MANTEFCDVEIFTTPTCPDCRQLKAWLTLKQNVLGIQSHGTRLGR